MKKVNLLIEVILFISLTSFYFYFLRHFVALINVKTITNENFLILIGVMVYMILIVPLFLIFLQYINKWLFLYIFIELNRIADFIITKLIFYITISLR